MAKAEVAYASLFFLRRVVSKPLPIDRTFPRIRIHREVADLECHQVLKEMAPLRRNHAEVAESGFDDDAGSGNLIPLDGNPQPWVVGAESPDTDEQLRSVLVT